MDNNTELQRLKTILNNGGINEKALIETAGKFVDLAANLKDVAEINFVIQFLENLNTTGVTQANLCHLHYFISNAYGIIIEQTISKTEEDWMWEQPLIEKELLNLRLAYQNITTQTDHRIVAFILNNLANRFDNLGRFLLSVDFWNKSFEIFNDSGMALVNTGNSLTYYGSNYLNDLKYQITFTQLAHQYFKKGLTKQLFPGVSNQVKQRLAVLETNYKPALEYPLTRSDYIIDYEPFDYGNWCTEHGLWLNPLSSINTKIDCNKDDLQLLHVDQELGGYFDSICQDYLYSRKLFFNSRVITDEDAGQQKKSAFREAYSIFDKLAYLLSAIFNPGDINSPRLSFSRMWYVKLDKNKGLLTAFTEKKNLMLRALYWVSKDIYLNEDGFKNMIEPKAKDINSIRNFIEHKSFKFGPQREQNFSLQLPVEEFDEHLLKLLKLVRETLFYAAYASLPAPASNKPITSAQ